MSDGMLLGIDEGTTGVKAALFDQRLQPVAEVRRDKVNRHPEEGWVEQDGEEVIAAVTGAVAELLEGADGEVVACGLDHQGESVLAWDSETGEPLSPIVVWQDKRSQEILDDLTDQEDEVKQLSGLPFDPYFSAAKLSWLLRHNDDVKKAREEDRLRMGTVDSFLCDQLGAGFATEPATASRTQLQRIDRPGSFDERLCEIFGIRWTCSPKFATARASSGRCSTIAGRSRFPSGARSSISRRHWPARPASSQDG
jgi:glycerol kinase